MRHIEGVLRQLTSLKNRGYKIKILIIGKSLQEILDKQRVYIYSTGILPADELGQYFRISDILVLPENKESGCTFKSGSLIVGLKNGLTILTNKGRMTDAALKDGENIVFTDFDNTEEFEKTVVWLIEHPHERQKIGERAKMVVTHLSWENIYQAYSNILSKK